MSTSLEAQSFFGNYESASSSSRSEVDLQGPVKAVTIFHEVAAKPINTQLLRRHEIARYVHFYIYVYCRSLNETAFRNKCDNPTSVDPSLLRHQVS